MKKSPAPVYTPSLSYFVPVFASLVIGILIGLFAVRQVPFIAMAKVSELGGLATFDSSAVVIPDNGKNGERAMQKLIPTTSLVNLSCQDPDDCDFTLDTTTAKAGDLVFLHYLPQTFPLKTPTHRMNVYNSIGASVAGLDEGVTVHFIYDGSMWSYID